MVQSLFIAEHTRPLEYVPTAFEKIAALENLAAKIFAYFFYFLFIIAPFIDVFIAISNGVLIKKKNILNQQPMEASFVGECAVVDAVGAVPDTQRDFPDPGTSVEYLVRPPLTAPPSRVSTQPFFPTWFYQNSRGSNFNQLVSDARGRTINMFRQLSNF